MSDRLTDLETRYSFQEDTLNALNDVIVRQQRQLEVLQMQVNRLQEQLEDMHDKQTVSEGGSQHERPPHY